MAKILTKAELTSLLNRCKLAKQYCNSIYNIRTNPTPYDDKYGPGYSWSCSEYGGSNKNFIAEDKRRKKYYDTGNSNYTVGLKATTAADYNAFRNALKDIYTALKQAVNNDSARYPASIDINKFPDGVVQDINTLAKYNSLFSTIDALEASLNYYNNWYNTNNVCILTCQVNCQTSCQVRCQRVSWCHDQKCGAH